MHLDYTLEMSYIHSFFNLDDDDHDGHHHDHDHDHHDHDDDGHDDNGKRSERVAKCQPFPPENHTLYSVDCGLSPDSQATFGSKSW